MRSRVELFEQIRRDRRLEELSIRELAERHGVHRRTVRQALAMTRSRRRARSTARGRGRRSIAWVDGDRRLAAGRRDAPRKQRHTARRVWQRLVAEHGARAGGGDGVALRRAASGRARAVTGRGGDPADPSGRARRPRSTSASSTPRSPGWS